MTRDAAAPATLVLLMFAGYVKASPVLAWVPVDLTFLALLAVLIAAVTEPHRGAVAKAATGVLVAVFVVAVFQAPGTTYAAHKLQLLFLLTLPAMVAAPMIVSSPVRVRWLLRWTVVGALGIGLLIRLAPSTADLYGRLALEGSNTLALGRACGAGLVALFVLTLARDVRWWVAAPAALALLGLVFGSGSRGPLLGVVAGCLAVAATRQGGRRVRDLAVAAVLVVAGGWWGLAHASATSAQRITLLLSSGGQGASVEDRVYLYRHASWVVTHKPLGVGWGGLESYLQPIAPYPHNVILEVLGEAGWLGGAVFVTVLVLALFRARVDAAVFGLLVFWLTNALFSGDVNDNRALFMLLGVALAVGLYREADPMGLRAEGDPGDRAGSDRRLWGRHPGPGRPEAGVGARELHVAE